MSLLNSSKDQNYLKYFLLDMSPFCERPLIPLFWTFGDISSWFQSTSGQPYSCLTEAYVLHVLRDSPLVWHLLPLDIQHGSVADLFDIPASRHWWDSKPGSIIRLRTTLRWLTMSKCLNATFRCGDLFVLKQSVPKKSTILISREFRNTRTQTFLDDALLET